MASSDSWRTGRGGRGGRGRGRGRGGGGGGGLGGQSFEWQSGRGQAGWSNANATTYDGKRVLTKAVKRPTIEYYSTMNKLIEQRVAIRDYRDIPWVQADESYYQEMLPVSARPDEPAECIATRCFRQAMNKNRFPVFVVKWTPEGRRLITGISSGEFTLWKGIMFNFETILQAHECSVRCMKWSNDHNWMITGDDAGTVKYWQSNMNNVSQLQAHKDVVRQISFAPTDKKFATCSDDGTVRIFDFKTAKEEQVLRGHGSDVKAVDWHPSRGLIASGSRDAQQPVMLWDPRTGKALTTLHMHKNTVTDVKWNMNGNWLLSSSRDHLAKIFDIRTMKELQVFRGHSREVMCLAWHPVHESLFASGAHDGSIMFWQTGSEHHVGAMENAHDQAVWSLDWHPLGHILASGSNDHTTKFFTRNRPGDDMNDKYNLNRDESAGPVVERRQSSATLRIPGIQEAVPGLARTTQTPGETTTMGAVPGLGGSIVPGLGGWSGVLPPGATTPVTATQTSNAHRNRQHSSNQRPPPRPPTNHHRQQPPPRLPVNQQQPPRPPPPLQQQQQPPPHDAGQPHAYRGGYAASGGGGVGGGGGGGVRPPFQPGPAPYGDHGGSFPPQPSNQQHPPPPPGQQYGQTVTPHQQNPNQQPRHPHPHQHPHQHQARDPQQHQPLQPPQQQHPQHHHRQPQQQQPPQRPQRLQYARGSNIPPPPPPQV
eukprot:m.80586 g.80586  ORF g.80586 m.80586 type:complete len:708 (+) comp25324_c0_seq1:186-2309(+)